ncbi:Uncharacterised protein [Klebsiella pneumoniae]|uniref:Uncharacterized protein n=1 Tax=Klebsiella pneumoniae TaxID=573 RepID=A0A3S4HFA7_KLEPN|nr:Uncharacterised protein [Klebsiella pneumoniae]
MRRNIVAIVAHAVEDVTIRQLTAVLEIVTDQFSCFILIDNALINKEV